MRRRAARRPVAADEPLAHAKLRTGGQLRVLDASNWGVLVETVERLLPGRHIDVHIVTPAGRTLVRSRVARACVCHLEPDAIHYQAALAFEQPIDSKAGEYSPPAVLASLPTAPDPSHPDRRDHGEIVFEERPGA